MSEQPAIRRPSGALTLAVVAMPRDTNPSGAIFGGWILSQMDLAGGVVAGRRARAAHVVTAAVEAMSFHRPVNSGDLVLCYAEIRHVGRTSMRVGIEVWVERKEREPGSGELVTEGLFTYVALDGQRRPRPVDPEPVDPEPVDSQA